MDPNEASDLVTTVMESAGGLIVEYGMSVIGAIVLFIVGRIVASWARGTMTKALTKAGTDASLVPFFASMLYYVILGVVIIAVLNLFGIETTSLLRSLLLRAWPSVWPCRARSRTLRRALCC